MNQIYFFQNIRKLSKRFVRNFSLFHIILFIFCVLSSHCFSEDIEKLLERELSSGLKVDLKNPLYSNGTLSTDEGGVITAPNIRIQAKKLSYLKKTDSEATYWIVEAEEQLIVQFGEYFFIGQRLIYDFDKREGIIFEGRTAIGPWFFGGSELQLLSDGSYTITNGYVTTSEKDIPDWGVYSNFVFVEKDKNIHAENIQFKIAEFPLLWIPSWRANLDSIFDSPVRYRFRWGGKQGPRLGLTYEIFSWRNWKTFVRFDYRFTKGPGGGVETYYTSLDNRTRFSSINYLAKDSSLLKLREKARYRFEGNLRHFFLNNKTSFLLTYDRISDKDMPNCYYDQDFFIETSYRTQLLLRHQEENWISNFYCRARINEFQTVKQELPTLRLNIKPKSFEKTGIIFENKTSTSYLDFVYSKHLPHTHNYRSTRIDYLPTLYRPCQIGNFTLTPEVGAINIFYGDSPKHNHQWLFAGKFKAELQTQFYRYFKTMKHVIEPYVSYNYYTTPTSSPKEHYIFDINDGYTRLNMVSFGTKHSIYEKDDEIGVSRIFHANLYGFAFFDTNKLKHTIPRLYAECSYLMYPTLRHVFNTAWNFDYHQLDYFNYRSEWTVSKDLAINFEYRHRGPYSWRKVDPTNFFLDMYHSENRLFHSAVSDRRDTLLLNFFYRFHPNWACEFTARKGWNRKHEKGYTEYEIDLLTTIQTAWNLRFSFQHQESETRFAMFVTIGLTPPNLNSGEYRLRSFD